MGNEAKNFQYSKSSIIRIQDVAPKSMKYRGIANFRFTKELLLKDCI